MAAPYQISDWYGDRHTCHSASGATDNVNMGDIYSELSRRSGGRSTTCSVQVCRSGGQVRRTKNTDVCFIGSTSNTREIFGVIDVPHARAC